MNCIAPYRALKDRRGFSLLEMLIAVVILAIGLMAAASMQGTALNSDSLAYRSTVVTTIAQQVMDDLNSAPIIYTQPPSGWYAFYTTPAVDVPYTRFPLPQYVPNVGTFTATYTVQPNTPQVNISQVTVQILMTTPTGTRALPFRLVGHREIPSTTL